MIELAYYSAFLQYRHNFGLRYFCARSVEFIIEDHNDENSVKAYYVKAAI